MVQPNLTDTETLVGVDDTGQAVWTQKLDTPGAVSSDGEKNYVTNAEKIQIYLPGKPTSETPAEFLDWVNRSYSWPGVSNTAPAAMPFAGIYNVNGKQGWSQSS